MSEREQISPGLQDVAEGVRAEARFPFPERPYKFLHYFEASDQPIFFGRDEEVNHLVQHIMAHRLTVLFGQSGVGKTSLINAGVIPRLEEEGYTSLYLRVLREPAASITQAALKLVGDEGTELAPTVGRRSPTESLCSFLERTLHSSSSILHPPISILQSPIFIL